MSIRSGIDSSRAARRTLGQPLIAERKQVERDVPRRGLLGEHRDSRFGRVDPLLQRPEVLVPVGRVDHDLAVEHVAARWEAQLREVPRERLPRARLDRDLVTVHEHDRPEAVVLGLVRPLLARRQSGPGASELWLKRRLQREVHGAAMLGDASAPVPVGPVFG